MHQKIFSFTTGVTYQDNNCQIVMRAENKVDFLYKVIYATLILEDLKVDIVEDNFDEVNCIEVKNQSIKKHITDGCLYIRKLTKKDYIRSGVLVCHGD
jgi:hypothetical protein